MSLDNIIKESVKLVEFKSPSPVTVKEADSSIKMDTSDFGKFLSLYTDFAGQAAAEKNKAALERMFKAAAEVEVVYQGAKLHFGESLYVHIPTSGKNPTIWILGKYSEISFAKIAKIDFKRLDSLVEKARDAWNDAWKAAGL